MQKLRSLYFWTLDSLRDKAERREDWERWDWLPPAIWGTIAIAWSYIAPYLFWLLCLMLKDAVMMARESGLTRDTALVLLMLSSVTVVCLGVLLGTVLFLVKFAPASAIRDEWIWVQLRAATNTLLIVFMLGIPMLMTAEMTWWKAQNWAEAIFDVAQMVSLAMMAAMLVINIVMRKTRKKRQQRQRVRTILDYLQDETTGPMMPTVQCLPLDDDAPGEGDEVLVIVGKGMRQPTPEETEAAHLILEQTLGMKEMLENSDETPPELIEMLFPSGSQRMRYVVTVQPGTHIMKMDDSETSED